MNWLYSIALAGLLFSNNSDSPAKLNNLTSLKAAPAAHVNSVRDETETIEKSFPLTANGRVSVSNVNGSIEMTAWDRPEVKMIATKVADSKASLDEVEINIDARADSFAVEAQYPHSGDKLRGGNQARRIEVQFKIWVPRTAVLNEIETVNGSVKVSDFTNFTKVSAVNGNVSATNLRGTANLETVNGEVQSDFDSLESGTKVSLSTVNGRVVLTLPSDVNATLKAESLNGNITNGFGLPVRKGKYVGRDLYGRLGSGDVQVRLESVNGDLSVNRKNDGRNVNPATDLLQQKSRDDDMDEDDSDNQSSKRGQANINREVARQVRDAQRDTQRAMLDAQREIAKAQPMLDEIKLKDLSKVKITLDARQLEASIADGLAQQKIALARLATVNWGGVPVVDKRTDTIAVKGKSKITVDARNCAVSVKGWDRNEVKYVVTRFAAGNARSYDVRSSENGGRITITVSNIPENDDDIFAGKKSFDSRVDIYVPKRSDLKIITNKEIRLDGVSGDVDLEGKEGSIDVRDSDGKLTVAANSDQIRVVGYTGDVVTKTTDGDIYLEGDFSSIDGQSGSGNYYLALKDDANADVVVDSDALDIRNMPNAEKVGEHSWRIGRGGPKFRLMTGDGSVTVRRLDTLVAAR